MRIKAKGSILLDAINFSQPSTPLFYFFFPQIILKFGKFLQSVGQQNLSSTVINNAHNNMRKQQEEDNQIQSDKNRQQPDDQQQKNSNSESGSENQYEGKWKKIQKPDKWINLFMIDFNQCDGKKCTGRKMERFQLLKALRDRKKKFKGVVLTAFGDKPISVQDLDLCLKNGICVIDCSWNRLQETNQFRFKNQRILPYVVAGNPVNYGKPFQLSCVQALATGLCTLNFTQQAEYIMSKFGWADGFWTINSRLKQYGNCKNIDQLQKLSVQIQQSENTLKQRSYDLESSNSDSSDNDQQEQEEQQQVEEIRQQTPVDQIK